VLANNALQKQREAQVATRLERQGMNALQQFESAELDALVSAMEAGQELKEMVKDGRPLADYPTTSPILALQSILDNILERNQTPEQMVRHDGNKNISFSPKGERLTTVDDKGVVRLWNFQGKQLAEFKGGIESVKFSPNGERLATVNKNGVVKLWNLKGQQLTELKGHLKRLEFGRVEFGRVEFSPNSDRLATVDGNGIVKLWNLKGQQLTELKHTGDVYQVKFSSDGERLAIIDRKDSVKLWNLKGQLVAEFKGLVNEVKFSPNDKVFATREIYGITRVWNLKGQLLAELNGDWSYFRELQFSPDAERLTAVSTDNSVRVWNLKGLLVAELRGNQERHVNQMEFSSDGERLLMQVTEGAMLEKQSVAVREWQVGGLERLLNRGCDWLEDYFVTHPEAKQKLKVCQKR
jgi:WD40 repeat protein